MNVLRRVTVLNCRIKYWSTLVLRGVEDVRSHQAFVLMIALMFFSSFLSLYTVKAHAVVRHIIILEIELPIPQIELPSSNYFWPDISGSLFPCPREPGQLDVLSRVSEVDIFIYRYLIKTWALAGLSILAWISTGVFMLTSMTRKSGLNVLS